MESIAKGAMEGGNHAALWHGRFEEGPDAQAVEFETSIYVDKDFRHFGIGKLLLERLEELLQKQNILNVNACIAFTEQENEYLTNDSFKFHKKMGYTLVGTFHKCGYKFDKWFDMIWMEKIIGKHIQNQPEVLNFNYGL